MDPPGRIVCLGLLTVIILSVCLTVSFVVYIYHSRYIRDLEHTERVNDMKYELFNEEMKFRQKVVDKLSETVTLRDTRVTTSEGWIHTDTTEESIERVVKPFEDLVKAILQQNPQLQIEQKRENFEGNKQWVPNSRKDTRNRDEF